MVSYGSNTVSRPRGLERQGVSSLKAATAGDVKTGRNYGIDCLRLVLMLFVVFLHINYHGTILDTTQGKRGAILWFIEMFSYCAVDCYAVISGYVMYSEKEKPYRYSRYVPMWLQVFTYSVGIFAAKLILRGVAEGDIKYLIESAFPVTMRRYWYFTAYTGLFFVVPFLNKALRALNKRQSTYLIATLSVGILFVCPATHYSDVFALVKGYSFTWLVVMYLFGAWLKKCDVASLVKKRWAIAVFVLSTVVTWCARMFSPEAVWDSLIQYTSPMIVLNALSLVMFFSKIKLKGAFRGVVAFLSPAAFGVYIIHEHPLVVSRFEKWFSWIGELWAPYMVIAFFGCAIAFFVICISVEKVRLKVFEILRINVFFEMLFNKILFSVKKGLDRCLSLVPKGKSN